MAYSEKVLDHYENPRNVGKFDADEDGVGTGMVGAPACGDVMKLQIKVDEDGIIRDARFKTYGCLTSNAPVNTPTCIKKIKDLTAGDLVLAWNGNQIVNQKIRDIIKHSVDVSNLLVVSFQRETSRKNINPSTFSLICTKEHIFWNADNKPVEAQQLQVGQELYEITEHELRILTNNRHRTEIKQKNSARMKKWNKEFDHSVLPQNQPGYVCKDLVAKKQRSSSASIKNWQDISYIEKWQQGMAQRDWSKPTSIEKKYIDLFEENNVAARWSAGKIWIQTTSGPASPDFIVPGKKKCIEVYTKKMPKFMQDRSEESDYVQKRSQQLATAGYDSLFLSVEEIDQALPKVQNFIHNGMKIIDISPITHRNQLRGCERDGKNVVVYDLKLEDGAHVFFTNRVGSHNCGSAIASSSLITEWVKGKTLDEAGSIKNSDIAQELALPPVKIHCSILAEDAIKAAIADYRTKHEST
jgi:NifU-like protein involved in Fe-S cluster formation